MRQKMKVSNQNEYNKFLQERENIFRYIDEAIENWNENNPKVTCGNNINRCYATIQYLNTNFLNKI